MVTTGGTRNGNGTKKKKRTEITTRKTYQTKLSSIIQYMETKTLKIIIIGLAIASVFAIVNALVDTRSYEYQLPPPPHEAEIPAVKPTTLITELGQVGLDEHANMAIINFDVANVNATMKLDHFECSIDAKGWKECISPVALNLDEYDNLNNHTLEIRAIDNHNGVEEQPLVHFFK